MGLYCVAFVSLMLKRFVELMVYTDWHALSREWKEGVWQKNRLSIRQIGNRNLQYVSISGAACVVELGGIYENLLCVVFVSVV